MPNVKMHTGCNCYACRKGRDKRVRKIFHKMARKKQKQQLKNNGEVVDVDISIGYTD